MKYTIEFGGDPHDVTLTPNGTATVDGLEQMNKDLVADERYEPGMLILVDYSSLDVTSLTTADVETLANGVVRHDTGGQSVAAIVAPQPALFGLVRMSVTLVEKATLTAQAFYSRGGNRVAAKCATDAGVAGRISVA